MLMLCAPERIQVVGATCRGAVAVRSCRKLRCLMQWLVLGLLLYALAGCANLPKRPALSILLPWQVTHSLENVPYILIGDGPVTVVIEMGAGTRMGAWKRLVKEISHDQRVLLYARAGATDRHAGSNVVAAGDVVTDLESLLRELDITEPLLLVGHSFGAIYMQTFARRYPDRVVGVLLLDPATPNLDPAMWPGANQPSMSPLIALKSRPQTKAEYRGQRQSITQMAASGPFPPKPLMVLSAGKNFHRRHKAQYRKLVVKEHQRIAHQSPLGEHKVVAQSRHDMHRDVPDVILQCIRSMLKSLQTDHAP